MSYSKIIFIILSFLSISICLFTIWLAIIFYRRYTQFSLLVTEIAKGLDIITKRLEKLPKILYGQALILPKTPCPDNQIIKEKEKEKGCQEGRDKDLSEQILQADDTI